MCYLSYVYLYMYQRPEIYPIINDIFVLFQDERTFSEEEEEKLQSSLSLTDGDLELVIHTLEFILHQVNIK